MTAERDRLGRSGVPGIKGFPRIPLEQRFWAKVIKTSDGCWLWTGGKTGRGYGLITIDGHHRPAHRVAWELYHGHPMDPSLDACHICDTPLCVNPNHIFPATPSENALDAKRKGRLVQPWGPQPVCRNGHVRTPENTLISRGHQECRICRKESNHRRYVKVGAS